MLKKAYDCELDAHIKQFVEANGGIEALLGVLTKDIYNEFIAQNYTDVELSTNTFVLHFNKIFGTVNKKIDGVGKYVFIRR